MASTGCFFIWAKALTTRFAGRPANFFGLFVSDKGLDIATCVHSDSFYRHKLIIKFEANKGCQIAKLIIVFIYRDWQKSSRPYQCEHTICEC